VKRPAKRPSPPKKQAALKKGVKSSKPKASDAVVASKASPPAAQVPAESPPNLAKAKTKLVRDSFTMPHFDFRLIAVLKDRALDFKRPTKKSELLRAGLHALNQLTEAQLRLALETLVPLKAGRPSKKSN